MLPSKLVKILPDWASRAVAQPRSWKLFLRCWVATWVCFILILPQRTLEALGTASFFASMACFMLPPNMAFQVYFFSTMTLLIGCLVGWAWGSIGMVSAFAARNKPWLENTVREVQQAAANDPNPTTAFQKAVFGGEFLDIRSTAVFGVFLGTGTFALTIFRVRAPKLVFAGIFGNVFLDVICSFGPLLPAPNYFTLQTFLVSSCTYVAVGLASIILIFPETLGHEWLNSYTGVLDMIKMLIDMQEGVLSQPADQLEGMIAKMNGLQEGAQAMFQGFTSMTPMLNLEFSYGRWSGSDVETLEFPLKALITRARGMTSFATQYTQRTRARSVAGLSNTTTLTSETSDASSVKKPSKVKRLQVQDTPRVLHVRDHITALEAAQHTQIEELVPVLRTATAELRAALSKGLESVSGAIRDVNERRYKSIRREPLDALRTARENLATTLATYKSTTRVSIVKPLADAFEAASGHMLDEDGKRAVSFRPLFTCFVFESNLCWTVDAVLALMDVLLNLMQERTKNRLWAPTGLRKLGSALFGQEGTVPVRGLQAVPEPAKDDEYLGMYRRDPDSREPKGVAQKFAYAVWSVWSYLRTNEAIFALKCTVLTLALWLPQVIKSSAEFTYNERGLWAMIMAQFGLEMYMSDQISGFIIRAAGTIVGGIIGILMWYIGCGTGPGNPYGLAAAFGVFIIPLVFARLFWHEKIAETIIISVTVIMMGGFSWTNTHLPTMTVIYGYEIFWRRTLLVLVGFAASFVMMILPPQSARKAVRLNNATTISEISQIYGILISSWLSVDNEDVNFASQEKEDSELTDARPVPFLYDKWTPAFRTKCMTLGTILGMQKRQFRTIKWERSLRGRWPGEHYERLLEIQTEMLSNLIQLAGSLSTLSPSWRNRLLHRTAFLNPNLISDVMAIFDIVSMSLRTGQPVHEVLPSNLLDRALYHDEQSRTTRPTQIDGMEDASPDEPLTIQLLQSTEYSAYATGVSAAFHLLHSLDEMHLITKELCGAIPLRGYSQWREQHELKQLQRLV